MSSGLRNPPAAVRGVGAAALATEALVLLLALAPLSRVGGPARGAAMAVVGGLALLALLLAGLLRHGWTWYAGAAVPLGLVAAGWLHLSLSMLGILFGLLWLYVLNVRRTVLGRGPTAGSPSG